MRLTRDDFSTNQSADFSFWYIGVHDEHHNEIYRRDLSRAEIDSLPLKGPEMVLVCELQSGSIPAGWTVWPVSRSSGWLKKIEGKFEEDDYTIIREDDEG